MLETDYRFTGQRQESNAGLYDYGPRFYDNYLNRWLSPDTIVPDPSNPQSLNRYSYSLNNPVKYNDPSGHCVPACLPWIYVATPLTVNPVTVEAAGAVGLVGITGYGAFQVGLWAAEDNGPNYPLPSIDYMGGVQSTYSLAGTTTLSVDSGIVLYKAEGAVKSMAAHMGYTFQNPLGGWDPKKKPEADNSVETNARHIRDALHDIKDNLSRGEDLRSYLKDNLTEKQYNSFTKALDDYASGLQDGGWLREQIGNDDLSGDILKLLKDTGYTSQ
jgi:RHS repeat-associated protein